MDEGKEKYRKKHLIPSLKEGDEIDDIFVVEIKKGISQYSGGYRFILLLTDSSGRTIEYIYWGGGDEEKVRRIYDGIKVDSVVRIRGKVSQYGGKLRLVANEPEIIQVLDEEQYEKEDFVKPARMDLDMMYERLMREIEGVENPQIRELLERIFGDATMKRKMKVHPGAISIHHNWIGGLLQHTLEVLDFCKVTEKNFPSLNHDLLVAGALLHDIGKLEEMEVTTRIKGTNEGQLIGHVMLGFLYVAEKIKEIPDFDEELKSKILHIILSHHGKNENGSPKEPMFPEALAVYLADEMSARMAEIIEFVEISRESTEDDFMYSRRQRKNIFLK